MMFLILFRQNENRMSNTFSYCLIVKDKIIGEVMTETKKDAEEKLLELAKIKLPLIFSKLSTKN
jgi:hypothetical protein